MLPLLISFKKAAFGYFYNGRNHMRNKNTSFKFGEKELKTFKTRNFQPNIGFFLTKSHWLSVPSPNYKINRAAVNNLFFTVVCQETAFLVQIWPKWYQKKILRQPIIFNYRESIYVTCQFQRLWYHVLIE